MTEEQRAYDAGEQVLIICKLTRYNVSTEAYVASDASASYPTYLVTDPDGDPQQGTEEQVAIAMTNQTTGYYYIYYTIPDPAVAGWWIVKIATENDNTISYDGFLVKR